MIKTLFYTFLQTKHQERNADPTDLNYPLFPQEVEIRPIILSPWDILKTLTVEEIWNKGKFQLPMEQIQDTMLRHVSQDGLSRTTTQICEIPTVVKDLDTNTYHNAILWKYPHEDDFAMRESWIEEFVTRRTLVAGMVVGMYWDFECNMFCFSVLGGPES